MNKNYANKDSTPDIQGSEEDWFNDEGRWAEKNKPKSWHTSDNPTERKEIQKIINICKDHLKALQQHVFILKYLEDLVQKKSVRY